MGSLEGAGPFRRGGLHRGLRTHEIVCETVVGTRRQMKPSSDTLAKRLIYYEGSDDAEVVGFEVLGTMD